MYNHLGVDSQTIDQVPLKKEPLAATQAHLNLQSLYHRTKTSTWSTAPWWVTELIRSEMRGLESCMNMNHFKSKFC